MLSRYKRVGKLYYKLETAIQHQSSTHPFAFVIAHECKEPYIDSDKKTHYRIREYYAFDNVDVFVRHQTTFPHSHEVIYPRNGTQEGRLVFDFDVTAKNYIQHGNIATWVSPSFQKDIERCVLDTFHYYYNKVDANKIRFVWLHTENTEKYSKHLIVNGAVFSTDWVLQSQTFYPLFKYVAYKSGLFSYFKSIDELVDTQIARTNATFRLAWCSKLGGNIMLPENRKWENGVDVSLYDTLVQLHRREEAKNEQRIMDSNLAIDKVLNLVTNIEECDVVEKNLLRNVPQLRRSLEDMERKANQVSLELTKSCSECIELLGDCYEVRDITNGRITLDRTQPGPCPVTPSTEHDREGGFITVNGNGDAYFHCFRSGTSCEKRAMLLKKGVVLDAVPTVEDSINFLLSKAITMTPLVSNTTSSTSNTSLTSNTTSSTTSSSSPLKANTISSKPSSTSSKPSSTSSKPSSISPSSSNESPIIRKKKKRIENLNTIIRSDKQEMPNEITIALT